MKLRLTALQLEHELYQSATFFSACSQSLKAPILSPLSYFSWPFATNSEAYLEDFAISTVHKRCTPQFAKHLAKKALPGQNIY